MFKVGDTVLGNRFVIIDIRDNYRTFELQSVVLGDATGPFIIGFNSNQTVEDINDILGL